MWKREKSRRAEAKDKRTKKEKIERKGYITGESEEGQGLGRRRGEQREGAESKFKTQL